MGSSREKRVEDIVYDSYQYIADGGDKGKEGRKGMTCCNSQSHARGW